MNSIEQSVRELVKGNVDLFDDLNSIDYDSDLTLYGMDSISAIQLIVAIEVKYDYEFPVEDLDIEKVNSIKKVIDYIQRNVLKS